MASVSGDSADPKVPGVFGKNTGGGVGVEGQGTGNDGVMGTTAAPGKSGVSGIHSANGNGLYGGSAQGTGVWGQGANGEGVHGESAKNHGVAGASGLQAGVYGESPQGIGSQNVGVALLAAANEEGSGVLGLGKAHGVAGVSIDGVGVRGHSKSSAGVQGESEEQDGVTGSTQAVGKSGVSGIHGSNGNGVFGASAQGTGVWGQSTQGDGVRGTTGAAGKSGVAGTHSGNGNGIYGASAQGDGVFGTSAAAGRSGVAGLHSGNGNGVYGHSTGGHAGWFDGDVMVKGRLTATIDIFLGADCAEEFDIVDAAAIEPGTVMVIDAAGALQQSCQPYDKRVAGVISGAGDLHPGITLGKQEGHSGRLPIALIGKVYCKVDADYGRIEVGDLLTTSPTPGHAMKAGDMFRAFGAVLGKALRPLPAGQALIPVLIALQ